MKKQKTKKPNTEKSAFRNWISPSLMDTYLKPFCIDTKERKFFEKKLLTMALKERVSFIASLYTNYAPKDYPQSLTLLMNLVRSEHLQGFNLWPACHYIQINGLLFFEPSMEALCELTQKFTAEFAIRPFIKKDPVKTIEYLMSLKSHPNEHVRRWVSEGTRPKLPWGEKLDFMMQNPDYSFKILGPPLIFDHSLYVQKSVANHLNDLSTLYPNEVLNFLKYHKENPQSANIRGLEFITKTALRTLIKQGYAPAFELLGYKKENPLNPRLKAQKYEIKKQNIKIGQYLEFSLQLKNTSRKAQNYVLFYKIYFVSKNKKESFKLYKTKTGYLEAGESILIERKHSFRPITTKKYYPGLHYLSWVVNGVETKKSNFKLS